MNAAGRVKRPSRISRPPTISITPAAPSREASSTVAPLADGGIPKSFCVPCSRYRNAVTTRRTLSRCGDQLGMAGRIPLRRPPGLWHSGRVALNRKRILAGALIGLVAGFAAFGLGYTPLFESWERRTLDIRSRWFANVRHADPNIVAVVIDQRSIDFIAGPREAGGRERPWPWPRAYHGVVADYLLKSGARAVAFDLIFSERSLYATLGESDDDRDLAERIAGKPVVQSVMFTYAPPDGSETPPDRKWPDGLLSDRGTRRLVRAPAVIFN